MDALYKNFRNKHYWLDIAQFFKYGQSNTNNQNSSRITKPMVADSNYKRTMTIAGKTTVNTDTLNSNMKERVD